MGRHKCKSVRLAVVALWSLVITGLIAGGLLVPSGAMALSNSPAVATAPPWIALIITNGGFGLQEDPWCTGTVVGDGWVLTAAHCVYSDGKVVKPSERRVLIGRNDRNARNQGAAYGVASIRPFPGFLDGRTDAALIQLQGFDSDRWHAVPLAFEPVAANGAGGVTIFGYGFSGWSASGGVTQAGTLRKSPDGAFVRSSGCDASERICFKPVARSRTLGGDSGAPWLRWRGGAWQLIGVHNTGSNDQALPNAQAVSRATSAFSKTAQGKPLLNWVRETAALPLPPRGSIVRNPKTGASWLVATDGYRNWIPTGGDYLCLTGQGARVINMSQITIDSIPDRVGTHARCQAPSAPGAGNPSSPAIPTTPTAPIGPIPSVRLAQGPAAPAGYRYAVTVSGFSAGARVAVSCHDSVDPGGFFSFILTADGAGNAFTQGQCYSADGPDHWVIANGIESNRVSWGAAPQPQPQPIWQEQQGSLGVNTFTNPYNASGLGPRIAPYQWVGVSCKVYAPQIASANPDGYWYRIASAPWSNAYYSPANTFWNGDVPGQLPYTHNTDFAVPNC